MASILVDPASGSKSLLLYPPLNDPNVAEACSLAFLRDGKHGDSDGDPGGAPMAPTAPTASAADVCIRAADGRLIGIEVKEVCELVQALDTGRLQHSQIPAMRAVYDASYLVYYAKHGGGVRRGSDGYLEVLRPAKRDGRLTGELRWFAVTLGADRPVTWSYLQQALLSISLLAGVQTVALPDLALVAYWIGELATWAAKPSHDLFRGFDESQALPKMAGVDRVTQYAAEVAHSLAPGMGYARSMAVAMAFPSAGAMLVAALSEPEALAEVEVPDGASKSSAVGEPRQPRRRRLGPVLSGAVHSLLWEERGNGSAAEVTTSAKPKPPASPTVRRGRKSPNKKALF